MRPRFVAATVLCALLGCQRAIKTEPLDAFEATFAAAHAERRILALVSPG